MSQKSTIRDGGPCPLRGQERRSQDVGEADLVNAVLWKHLKDLTTKDVLEYREKVLGKD